MAEKRVLQENGKDILPITHESAVIDDNGVTLADKIGDISQLQTESSNLVDAINEVFQYGNNAKQSLVDALIARYPDISTSTSFDDLISNVNSLLNFYNSMLYVQEHNRSTLYQVMLDGGYNVDESYNLDTLISILETEGIFMEEIEQFFCGHYSAFILKTDGTLWACGLNANGQLGLGDTKNRTTFTQVTKNVSDVKEIFAGYNHTFLLKNDGTLWACGLNNSGQLGLGNTDNSTTFTQVKTNISDVKQIACGEKHSILLKNDGTLWACGSHQYGQLGMNLGYYVTYASTFTKVNAHTDVSQVACGYNFSYILKNDGTVYACGQNKYGELAASTSVSQRTTFTKISITGVRAIRCGAYHCFVINTDNTVKGVGYNEYGQLGTGNTANQTSFLRITTVSYVKDIICGGYHTFVIKQDDNSVWFTGRTNYGQLGSGSSSTNSNKNVLTKITHISDFKSIFCGSNSTFVIKNDDTLWSTGFNTDGQLGLGDTTHRSSFTLVTLPET